MLDKNSPIAVIDSGVGGISVLRELIKLMPYENYIYFGDNINAPYGTKSEHEVKEIMYKNAQMLLGFGAKAIVIACNTATGASVKELREKYLNFPIIGIEPAIKLSAEYEENSNVLVMATPLTLKQDKLNNLIDRFSQKANFITLPCPGLMELIEEGKLDGDELETFLKKLFSDLKTIKLDSVVLGCTHYSHIKDTIKKILGNDIKVFDGCEGTAKETKRRLTEIDMINASNTKGYLKILSSKDSISELSLALLKR